MFPAHSQSVTVARFAPLVFHFVRFSLSLVSLCQCARLVLVRADNVQREWSWTMLHCEYMILRQCDVRVNQLRHCDSVKRGNSESRLRGVGGVRGKWVNGSKASREIFIIFSNDTFTHCKTCILLADVIHRLTFNEWRYHAGNDKFNRDTQLARHRNGRDA